MARLSFPIPRTLRSATNPFLKYSTLFGLPTLHKSLQHWRGTWWILQGPVFLDIHNLAAFWLRSTAFNGIYFEWLAVANVSSVKYLRTYIMRQPNSCYPIICVYNTKFLRSRLRNLDISYQDPSCLFFCFLVPDSTLVNTHVCGSLLISSSSLKNS